MNVLILLLSLSTGKFVDKLEEKIADYTNAKYAIAKGSGTSCTSYVIIIDVGENNEVITQPITFVATCNVINYCKAHPIFIDVDRETMGLSPSALKLFLKENAIIKNQQCMNIKTGRVIKACMPMHTYDMYRIDEIKEICDEYHFN